MATLSALDPDEDWKDGWDDEEELVFDDELEEVITKEPEKTALFSPNDGVPGNEADPAADGWEDEEEIVFDDEDEEALTNPISSNPAPPTKPAFGPDGWEDDPLLDDRVDVQSPPPAAALTMHSPVYEALERYLEQLPLLLPSINACLEAEFSTREKALELVQYYAARPGLAAYTIQTELPRMDYSLRNHHDAKDSDAIVTDKAEIARRLQEAASHDSLLPRAANQSILADVLQVCTGPDVLIRPQYAASCVAAACKMRLDLQESVLQVDCELELGLPCGEGGRWKVATVGLHVFFCCDAADPVLTYHLTSLERVPDWKQHLPMTARFLQEMHPPDEFVDATSSRNGGGGGVDFRDAFLQRVVRQGASGMQSAWKEMDAATGLGKRLALPGFLPSDVVEAAEAAQVPSVEPRAATATAATSRPTSILGGLVRSGWSTLASTVALPEEDPSLYQEWQADTANKNKPAVSTTAAAPSLYRKEAPPPPPSLYRKEEPPRPPTGPAPAFYRKEEPPTPPPTSKAPPTLYRKEEAPTPPTPAAKAPPTLYRKEEPATPPSAVKAPPTLYRKDPPPPPPREAPTLYRAEKPKASTPPPRPFPAVAKQSVPSPPAQEGWDDDEDLDFEEEELTVAPPVSSPPKQHSTPPQKTDEAAFAIHNDESIVFIVEEDVWPADFCHDPELDVMPTRQRWMHPRPGSRRLANFFLRTWA